MPANWTTCDRLDDDKRYSYRDRHCWISEEAGLLHMQETLVAPHDDYETVLDRHYPIADFLADTQAQEQLRSWFGDRQFEEILAASRSLVTRYSG